jgi:aspartate aminotransferase
MTITVSDRANSIQPSATLAVNARATELRREGKDIINLSVGEPDFTTPDFIDESAIKAIKDGFTKYTDADGIPELKAAIIHKLQRDNQLDYKPNQIIASAGVKQGLYNLCQALLNPGDEVIIPAPYWVSYPAMVKLAGATPVFIETHHEQHFKITADQLEAAITPKTKLVMLNSPSNPTGQTYNADELTALTNVLKKHPNIVLATDDIYEYILWGLKKFVNPLNVCPELKDRTVVFNGLSKAYAMTGWRLGYAAGPTNIIKTMKKIQSQSSGNPSSITQKAAVTALNADRSKLDYMLNAFKHRHDLLYAELSKIEGFSLIPSDGTFYLFPKVEQIFKKLGLKTDIEFATFLLENAQVATVPGTGFGSPGYIRFSYATDEKILLEACKRIKEALK